MVCCVFVQLLAECNNGSRGNPIGCEYTTGGNFLHALLQYRPLVSTACVQLAMGDGDSAVIPYLLPAHVLMSTLQQPADLYFGPYCDA